MSDCNDMIEKERACDYKLQQSLIIDEWMRNCLEMRRKQNKFLRNEDKWWSIMYSLRKLIQKGNLMNGKKVASMDKC